MPKYSKNKNKYELDTLTVPNISLELANMQALGDMTQMEEICFPKILENDADINKLEHELLKITQDCIPLAHATYKQDPKKSNADCLMTFVSQSREISHDIRNLQDKKRQTEKVLNECLKPSIMKIYNHLLTIKSNQEETLNTSFEDFDTNVKGFLKLILQEIQTKLEDIY